MRKLTSDEAYELGRALGVVRGQLEAAAATPEVARAYDRATLAMANAVHAAAIGNDAADYELHELYAAGMRHGRTALIDEAMAAYGHEAAVDSNELVAAYVAAEGATYGGRIEGAITRGLEAIDEAAEAELARIEAARA